MLPLCSRMRLGKHKNKYVISLIWVHLLGTEVKAKVDSFYIKFAYSQFLSQNACQLDPQRVRLSCHVMTYIAQGHTKCRLPLFVRNAADRNYPTFHFPLTSGHCRLLWSYKSRISKDASLDVFADCGETPFFHVPVHFISWYVAF